MGCRTAFIDFFDEVDALIGDVLISFLW